MPSHAHNQDHFRRLLEELTTGSVVSQRQLAARLGIALGHTNQLLRSLVAEGWVQALPGPGLRMTYVVTAAGAEARARMAREFLSRSVASFVTARDRILECLAAMTALPTPNGGPAPAVVLSGVGDVAQIAFSCAIDAGVRLVGFVDDGPRDSFLGLPVRAWADLTPGALDGRPFDWLLIGSLSDHDGIRTRLEQIGFPLDRVSWL